MSYLPLPGEIDLILHVPGPSPPSSALHIILFPHFPVPQLANHTNLDLAQHSQPIPLYPDELVAPNNPFILLTTGPDGTTTNKIVSIAAVRQLYYDTFRWILLLSNVNQSDHPPVSCFHEGEFKDVPIMRAFEVMAVAEKYGVAVLVKEVDKFLKEYRGCPSVRDTKAVVETFPRGHRARVYLIERLAEAIVKGGIQETRARTVVQFKNMGGEEAGEAENLALAVERLRADAVEERDGWEVVSLGDCEGKLMTDPEN